MEADGEDFKHLLTQAPLACRICAEFGRLPAKCHERGASRNKGTTGSVTQRFAGLKGCRDERLRVSEVSERVSEFAVRAFASSGVYASAPYSLFPFCWLSGGPRSK